jgi:hypothetical protein
MASGNSGSWGREYGRIHRLVAIDGAPVRRAPSSHGHGDGTGGRLLITVGLGTRVAALFCLIAMLVAVVIGHKGGGYLITNNPPGNEYALNLAILMLVLMLLGPGAYSLDHLIFSGASSVHGDSAGSAVGFASAPCSG